MEQQKIFVIVPVYNENAVIEQTMVELLGHGYPIIIVDDGSKEDVEEIVKKYPVIFLRHRLNLGQGAALQTGMKAAKKLGAEIVIHFDADGQHDANDLHKLIKPLLNNQCDIVFGSRFLNKSGAMSMSFGKKIILRAGRYINWMFYGILLSDAHNGLRAMNKTAIDKISITQNRMAHASEMLQLVKKNKLMYKEMPVTIRYTPYSQQKGQGIFNSVNILFDLIFKKLNR